MGKDKKKSVGDEQLAQAGELVIKPEKTAARLDTSKWPLLLKNYDKLNVRTGHYTPIPAGYTPLKRPLKDYLSYGAPPAVDCQIPAMRIMVAPHAKQCFAYA